LILDLKNVIEVVVIIVNCFSKYYIWKISCWFQI